MIDLKSVYRLTVPFQHSLASEGSLRSPVALIVAWREANQSASVRLRCRYSTLPLASVPKRQAVQPHAVLDFHTNVLFDRNNYTVIVL